MEDISPFEKIRPGFYAAYPASDHATYVWKEVDDESHVRWFFSVQASTAETSKAYPTMKRCRIAALRALAEV